jgi:hypothetical protein
VIPWSNSIRESLDMTSKTSLEVQMDEIGQGKDQYFFIEGDLVVKFSLEKKLKNKHGRAIERSKIS